VIDNPRLPRGTIFQGHARIPLERFERAVVTWVSSGSAHILAGACDVFLCNLKPGVFLTRLHGPPAPGALAVESIV